MLVLYYIFIRKPFRKKRITLVIRQSNGSYCGYVSSHRRTKGYSFTKFQEKYGYFGEELTFAGQLEVEGLDLSKEWFYGFDTNHTYETKETKNLRSVFERTFVLAEKMIKKRV